MAIGLATVQPKRALPTCCRLSRRNSARAPSASCWRVSTALFAAAAASCAGFDHCLKAEQIMVAALEGILNFLLECWFSREERSLQNASSAWRALRNNVIHTIIG